MVVSAGRRQHRQAPARSANDQHPNGLANGSDQVGRNYMFHNCKAVVALAKEPNDTVFQKTLGLNDFYFGADDYDCPVGNIQMVGKSNAEAMKGEEPKLTKLAPHFSLAEVARHAVDFWLTTEDLPMPDNRVTLDGDGNVHLAYTSTNDDEADRLYHELKKLLNHVGMAAAPRARQELLHAHGHPARRRRAPGRHRAGSAPTPPTSVLDADCKAHELDNLYVVDTSFFPSIGAVNPALTAMANAIRVGEHLLERARTRRAGRAMATALETQRRLRRRARAGHRAGHLPGGQHDLHRPDDYDLSSTQYGAMFLPQVVTGDRRCAARGRLARRFGTKRVYLVGLAANLVSMALLLAQRAVAGEHGVAYALLLLRHGLPRRRVRAHRAGAQHLRRRCSTPTRSTRPCSCSTPCSGSARRSRRCSWRSSSALGFWWGLPVLDRSSLLVGADRRQPAAAAAHDRHASATARPGAAARGRSRRGSGCSPPSRSSTASARP